MGRKAIIFGTAGAWHCEKLAQGLRKRGIETGFANIQNVCAQLGKEMAVTFSGESLSQFEMAFVREVPGGSLEQIIFRMDALHQLENSGLRVINSPYAIEKMVDKYYTLSLLQLAGLRVPETRVMEDGDGVMEAFEELGCDVVIKPLFGSRGVGMVRVTEADTFGRVCRALKMGGYVYYLQKFIPHGNRDLRVLVAGGECIAAMERVADGWKTNVSIGAKPISYALDEEVRAASLQAAQAVGADYCGIDLIRSKAGDLYLLEVNSMPGWEGLQEVTPFDIGEKIIDGCLVR